MMKLFVFGATGDLFKRKVLEGLQNLGNPELQIIAIGRKSFTDEVYQDFVCDNRCELWFKRNISYKEIAFGEESVYDCCKFHLVKDEINYFYASLPPQGFSTVVEVLDKFQQEGYRVQLLLEKPFGTSLDHAQQLRDMLLQKKLIEHTYLVDHYLFKEEILKLKQQNFTTFEMGATEVLGLENRVGYYEGTGALKDMIQNHCINTLSKILPLNETMIEKMEVKVFQKGQYQEYEQELGAASITETFVEVEVLIDHKTIRFVTGKALAEKKTWITIDDQTIALVAKKNEYEQVFTSFFAHKKEDFPTIEQAILGREIVEKIMQYPSSLVKYPKGSDWNDFSLHFGSK